ncbi:hypothetical protein NPX13_g7395 [Xylaria arbuscula]|uniref:Uncharacterized protein n=1 Tax=Xylaria arbuscula TaxID=114810 RepID=A0A9W8TL83_9PEZI|nr:hypothetical protein NPX13_g7395 [Xylaria arbuscula]
MAATELTFVAAECLKKVSQYRNHIDVGVIKSSPWDILEVSLAVSLLLEADCPPELFLDEANTLVSVLSDWLDHDSISERLAPRTIRDLEVAATITTTLNLLGKPTLADGLIASFDLDRFNASNGEDDGLSTNCELLMSLIRVENGIDRYRTKIEQVATSVCSIWWAKSHKEVINRRNTSSLYSILLLSKALTTYALAQSSNLDKEGILDDKISLMLTEALVTILRTQNEDGSWGEENSFEETCYAVLVIKYLTAFPFAYNFKSEIQCALDRSFDLISQRRSEWHSLAELWIGKPVYSSPILAQAYCISALKQPVWPKPPNMRRFGRFSLSSSSEKLSKLAHALPLLQNVETWQVKSCLLQGDQFARMVKASIPRIFPRENMRKETYLDLVPFTWATSRQFETLRLRNQELLDMMVLAVTIYQVDEFMEATVIQLDNHDMRKLDDAFDDLCSKEEITPSNGHVGNGNASSSGEETSEKSLAAITNILRQYIHFILHHPSVRYARASLQRQLRSDIKRFLRSHIRQVKDNRLLRAHKMRAVEAVHGSVFSWIRNTSSDHTGGPFAMTYYLCLIEGRGDSAQLISTEGLYVAQMVSQHLAALCRTYNDWGSRVRDKAEFNVNSLNFEEIRSDSDSLDDISGNGAFLNQSGTTSAAGHAEPERRLLFIAEFERRCMLNSLRELKEIVSPEVYVAVKLFCDVTDVYGQVYVVKDMTPRLKVTEQK